MREFFRALLQRMAALFRRRRLEDDLDEELRSHLEMAVELNLRKGMSAEDARREALRSFGGVEQTKELYRDQRGLDRKSTRLNSSHLVISYAVFCLKKKKKYPLNCLYRRDTA